MSGGGKDVLGSNAKTIGKHRQAKMPAAGATQVLRLCRVPLVRRAKLDTSDRVSIYLQERMQVFIR